MKIELKNVKFYEKLSEETNCFIADLYADGKRIGYCKNDGQGGSTYVNPWDKNALPTFNEAEEYCKSLPPIVYNDDFSIPSNLENVVDDLFEKWLIEKNNKKIQKELLKSMDKGICLQIGDNERQVVKFKMGGKAISLSDGLKYPHFVEHIKQFCHTAKKNGAKILNTNLPFEI